MPYGLNKRISLKDSIAITFLATADFLALGYEVCRKSSSPHLMEIPFEQTKSYLEKLTEKKLRKNTTYYKLKKKKVFQLDSNKIKIDLDSPWWNEFLSYRYRFFQAPSNWDKRWTVVIYDIPEDHNSLRNKFRNILDRLGFANWQRSVWLTVNPVTPLLKELILNWELKEFVTVFTAKNIFTADDKEMIMELFNINRTEKKYNDFIKRVDKELKLKNAEKIINLIKEFPYLVIEDSGIPTEFFKDGDIRHKVLGRYRKMLKLSQTLQ